MVLLDEVIVSSFSPNLPRGRIWSHRWSCTSCLSYSGGRGQDPLPVLHHVAPHPCPVHSSKHGAAVGGSEQPLNCLALPGLLQEQVFPSSMSPAWDRCPPRPWEVQRCAKALCPWGRFCRPSSPSLPPCKDAL